LAGKQAFAAKPGKCYKAPRTGESTVENDSVRTSGNYTLLDMWIDGKIRAISLSREAIETFLQLPPGQAAAMSDDDRREFVRTHLSLVVRAATNRLHETDPDADAVMIDAGQRGAQAGAEAGGQVSGRGGERSGERRQGDRRKGDRRKVNLGPPPSGERRR
jgi:hypothetical protein